MSGWVLWLAVASAAPDLTSSELEEVTKGEVVVRFSEDATQAVGAIDIAAPRERVLKALLDFDYRVKHGSILKSAEVYARKDRSLSVKFEAGILGSVVVLGAVVALGRKLALPLAVMRAPFEAELGKAAQ